MTHTDQSVFQMAFEQAWNAIVITSANRARGYPVEMVNHAFCRMTGYSADELKGRTLKLLQGPETDPEVLQRLRACLQEERYFEGMTTNYRKDGTPYVVRWNISPVCDPRGVLTHFVSVQQDMTEYVRSEQKVRMLAKVLDSTTDPILLTDAQAKIVFVNQAFANTTGYAAEHLIGHTPVLRQSVRASDPVIRWGGEEFLALLEGCQTEQALEMAERMRQRVAAFEHPQVGRVTVSLGLATWVPGESLDALIARADQALYASKASGRNRLTAA